MSLNRRTAATVTLVLGLASALSACDDATGPGGDGADPIDALPRPLTTAEQSLIARSNDFGLELLGRAATADERANVVLSPLSASMALGMTLNGATGATFDAMRATLGFEGMELADINAGYASLMELLTDLDPDVDVSLGNAVWANRGFPVHESFLDAVTDAFDATAETRDFADPATLDAINGWADEATDGMIPEVLKELDPDLVMLLMNAVAFDGAWTVRFDRAETREAPFLRADGSTVRVPTMHLSDAELPLGYGDGWTAVELPYGGGAYAMLVVVPSDGDPRSMVAGWDAGDWAAVRASLQPQEIDLVALPRFRVAHDAFLNPVLADMGMGIAFGTEADFSALSPLGQDLCIDFVRQKTFVEVDEEGTRAAAVTTVGVGTVSFTGVVADRPFLFAIHDRLSGTLLFTGVIGDPSLHDEGPQAGEGSCH